MRRFQFLIPIVVAMVLVAAAVAMLYETPEQPLRFQVEGQLAHTGERLNCWQDEAGDYYVFLPSYACLDNVIVEIPDDIVARIGTQSLQDGMDCGIFELERVYEYTFSGMGYSRSSTIRFLKSAGVSSIFLDTRSGSLGYIHADKENQEEGVLRIYSDAGVLTHEEACDSIGGRGNSTWEETEKKPYNLRLSQPADLLGMGSAQRWVLLANAKDDSHLRNKIVYDFAQSFGVPFSPEAAWVDLYINGDYRGLYLLCERNEVHDQRISIDQDNGFLVSMELESRLSKQGIAYVTTDRQQAFRIHYPDLANAAESSQIQQVLQSVENALVSGNSTDGDGGKTLEQLIDMDSWARKYLIEEVFGNMDASYISQYYFMDGTAENHRLYAGPVWDYDLSMGNRNFWQLSSPQILLADRLAVRPGVETPWMYSLCQKDVFRQYADVIYAQEMLPMMTSLLDGGLSNYAAQIAEASAMNRVRWADIYGDFLEDIAYISQYLTERVSFLSRIWLEGGSYHLIRAEDTFNTNYGYFAVLTGQSGQVLPELQDTPYERFCGWYDANTHEPLEPQKQVSEDIVVYALWEKYGGWTGSVVMELLSVALIALLFGLFFLVNVIRIYKYR